MTRLPSAALAGLTDVERAAVDLLAAFFAPTTMTELSRALGDLGTRIRGRRPSTQEVRPLLEGLAKRGLVTRGARDRINVEVAHEVMLAAVRAGTVNDLARIVRSTTPAGKSAGQPFASWDLALRELRLALYAGRWPEARAVAEGLPKFAFDDISRPFDAVWIAGLPADLRRRALAGIVQAKTEDLAPCSEAFAMLEAEAELADDEHRVLVERLILSGHLDDAERRLGDSRSMESDVGRAFVHLLRGRIAESTKAYAAAHARYLKFAGKRAGTFPDRAGLFYIVGLIADGKPASLDRALTLAKVVKIAQPLHIVYQTLSEIIRVLQGQLDPAVATYLNEGRSLSSRDTMEVILQAAALVWIRAKPPGELLSELETRRARAEAAGLRWYAAEAADLLARLSGSASVPWRGPGLDGVPWRGPGLDGVPWRGPFLAELVARRERWSEALAALVEIGRAQETRAAAAPPPQATRRLAWIARKNTWGVGLEPREQVLAKGAWSTGKPVALKRLYEDGAALDFLTGVDRIVCSFIEARTTYDYGRYPRVDHHLDAATALRALAGSPNVVLATPRGDQVPCEIRLVTPRLEVTRRDGGLLVSLVPRPRDEKETVAVGEVGANSVEIVEFTPAHHTIARALGVNALEVPTSGEAELRAALHALSGRVEVHADLEDAPGADAAAGDARPFFLLRALGEGLSVAAHVRPLGLAGPTARPGRGGVTFLAEVSGRKARAVRDLEEETRRLGDALVACPTLASGRSGDHDFVLTDRARALETVVELGELGAAAVVEWPDGEALQVSAPLGPERLRLKITNDKGSFLATGALEVPGHTNVHLAELADLLSASPGRFIRPADGPRYLALTADLRARIVELMGLAERSGKRLRLHRLTAAIVAELIEGARVDATDAWREQVRDLTTTGEDPAVPTTFRGELRPYQQDGFRWLARLSRWGAGACLADDMGLGKTIQTIALLVHRAADGPALVVAPTSVVPSWIDEITRFAPTLRPRAFTDGARVGDLADLGPFDVVVTSYGLLHVHEDTLAAIDLGTAVLDEAQLVKNRGTRRARAAARLRARCRVVTTGTPIENRLDDLHSLFSFLNPGLLGSADGFQARFGKPIEKDGDPVARAALRKLVAPFVLRRTKTEVLPELPARTDVTLRVPLGVEETAVYEAIREEALADLAGLGPREKPRFRILAAITRLREAASHARLVLPGSKAPSAKLAAFGDLLDELLPNGHRLLVFSQFVRHLALVKELCDERGVSYQYLDGSTPVAARKAAVDAFQAGQGEVFLISLKAGGFGLNLTGADYVIHMDPWWNPAVEDQASDRAHRIGQARPVTVYRVVARDTIEDRILSLHHRKRELAEGILEGGDLAGRMSEEDLLDLIRAPR